MVFIYPLYNKNLKFLNYKKKNFEIIGSAHNLKKFH